jgi:(1->4)-alpha-D-glucan 1-alpha-D-glucosylmutase
VPALRIPIATYRLQFSPRFGFEESRGLVPYLDALGVTDLYASPLFRARQGSPHGYDVTDPNRLNQELGSEEEFDALVYALKERDMGLLLDIVPNHMSASGENRWWMDVLENGAGSPYAPFFDIDWSSSKKALERKVLLPILGGPYGRILENQELSLVLEKSGFLVRYSRVKLPLSVKSYLRILSHRIETLEETYGSDSPSFRELWEIIASIEHLPNGAAADPGTSAGRSRDEEAIKQKLWSLFRVRPEIKSFLEENLLTFNGRKGNPESFEPLDRLLSEQHYWLSYWRLANEEINYRRFFAISDLIGLRVEDFEVFRASHGLSFGSSRKGR